MASPPAPVAEPQATPIEYAVFAEDPAARDAYDRAVDDSRDVDRFCSQHAFVAAAFEGLQPGRRARIFNTGGGAGWLAFAERTASIGADPLAAPLVEPLEAMWGLGCPTVGADTTALALALGHALQLVHAEGAPVILLCGLRPRSERLHALAAVLNPTHRVIEAQPTVRAVASLDGGVDGFLSRRSPMFRRKLARAHREATAAGVRYERHSPTTAAEVMRLYERAAVIDDRSWKGRDEAGLRATGLYSFYERMLPRLGERGGLRMGFLVDGETDVAYLFGGLLHGTFRGLQFAFVAGREPESLGNVVQRCEIEQLCEEGALRYDLGTDADYKRRWAELEEASTSVIAMPRGR